MTLERPDRLQLGPVRAEAVAAQRNFLVPAAGSDEGSSTLLDRALRAVIVKRRRSGHSGQRR